MTEIPPKPSDDPGEEFRVGADFSVEGVQVTHSGRTGTARADGSIQWDDEDESSAADAPESSVSAPVKEIRLGTHHHRTGTVRSDGSVQWDDEASADE